MRNISHAGLRRQLGELTDQVSSATARVHELEAESRTLRGVIDELQAELTESSEVLSRLMSKNTGPTHAELHYEKTAVVPTYNEQARERLRRVEAKLQHHRASKRQLKILQTSRAQFAEWAPYSEVIVDGRFKRNGSNRIAFAGRTIQCTKYHNL